MSVDETFKTGEYSFLSLKATDEVNESIYLDEYNEFLPDGHLGFTLLVKKQNLMKPLKEMHGQMKK